MALSAPPLHGWPLPLLECLAPAPSPASSLGQRQPPQAPSKGLEAPEGCSLRSLHDTLCWLEALLSPIAAGQRHWPPALESACEVAQGLTREAAGVASDLLEVVAASAATSEADGLLHRTLKHLAERLGKASVGNTVLVPVAWPEAARGSPRSLHAALIIVTRTGKEEGSLAVVNPAGSGSEYHLQRLEGPPTQPRLCAVPAHVSSVPWKRLCNSAFWLFVLQPLVRPQSADPHPALLYEVLLPFLTRQHRREQLASQLAVSREQPQLWQALPSADRSGVHCALGAVALALVGQSGSRASGAAAARWLRPALLWEALRQTLGEPQEETQGEPPPEELKAADMAQNTGMRTAREACRSLARDAAEVAEALEEEQPHGETCSWSLAWLEKLEGWLHLQLGRLKQAEATQQELPNAPAEWLTGRPGNAKSLTVAVPSPGGSTAASQTLDVPLPLPIAAIPERVHTPHDAACAVQQCLEICSVLSNQRQLIANADLHIFGLVRRLFFMTLPVPTPSAPTSSTATCIWTLMPMHFETQVSLMGGLASLLRHFLVASLALPRHGHIHSTRVLTLAAAASILDSLLRRVPGDSPACLSQVYAGSCSAVPRSKPTPPGFGLALVPLAEETSEWPLLDADATELRAKVLDYFTVLAETRPEDRTIFGFADMALGSGDLNFLHRLALLKGFTRDPTPDPTWLASNLVGKSQEFLAAFPGLATLRDAAFLLKLFCVPMTNATFDRIWVPDRHWSATDAQLHWIHVPEENRLRVESFQRQVSVTYRSLAERQASKQPGMALKTPRGEMGMLSRWLAQSTPSEAGDTLCPTCLALATNLAGQPVESEEDALHLPEVPTFDGALTPMESEQLLAYLSVPCLRVPLLLRFFNDPGRFSALASLRLQNMLNAVLFVPGLYHEAGETNEDLAVVKPLGLAGGPGLSTPGGRLIYEMIHSTAAVLQEIDGIFNLAMERDMPNYSSSAAPVLYAIGLCVRAAAFAMKIVKSPILSSGVGGAGDQASETLRYLREYAELWFRRLPQEAAPMLRRWCDRAMEAGNVDLACTLWAQLAHIYRWCEDSCLLGCKELSQEAVHTLLTSELYINANCLGASSSSAQRQGFTDAEVAGLFHEARPRVYAWLRDSHKKPHEVLERVVAAVAGQQIGQSTARGGLGRLWVELADRWRGTGRFAPSPQAVAELGDSEEDFVQWLAASINIAPAEVNVNLGQLQFRQQQVLPVPRAVLASAEFQEIFPEMTAGVLWSLVERDGLSERYRMKGFAFEFCLWKPAAAKLDLASCRDVNLAGDDAWRWLARVLQSIPSLQSLSKAKGLRWCAKKGREEAREELEGHEVALLLLTVPEDHGEQPRELTLRDSWELTCFRQPATASGRPVVHIYEVLQCGSQLWRVQKFASEGAWSYSPPEGWTPLGRREQGTEQIPPMLEVYREDLGGRSALVPKRLLQGSIPECLLEAFEFWRGCGGDDPSHALPGCIVGRPRRQASADSGAEGSCRQSHGPRWALLLWLPGCGGASRGPGSPGAEVLLLQRLELDEAESVAEQQLAELLHTGPKEDTPTQTFLDLLHAQPGSNTWEIARWVLLLDDLSHVLVWTQGWASVDAGAGSVDCIEFPRIGLSFSLSRETKRLQCDQHGSLTVVPGDTCRDDEEIPALKPLARFVLLEDELGERVALVATADRPSLEGGTLSLSRNDAEWFSGFRLEHRHQLFIVHPCGEFLLPSTLEAELYLMLLQILQGMYVEACEHVEACMASGHPGEKEEEEERLWQEIASVLGRDPSVDAAVLRLKFMLQLHHQGQGPPDAWDLAADLSLWTLRGTEAVAGRQLTPVEDAALLGLLLGPADRGEEDEGDGEGNGEVSGAEEALDHRLEGAESVSGVLASPLAWALQARRRVLSALLRCPSPRPETQLQVPRMPSVPGEESVLAVPGPLERGRLLLDSIVDERFLAEGPDSPLFSLLEAQPLTEEADGVRQRTGANALPLLLRRLPPQLPRDFHLLYELLTSRRNSVWLMPGDDPTLTGELLAFLLPPEQLRLHPPLSALLRALERNPDFAERMPRYDGLPEVFVRNLMDALQQHRGLLRASDVVQISPLGPCMWTFRVVQLDGCTSWTLVERTEEQPACEDKDGPPAGRGTSHWKAAGLPADESLSNEHLSTFLTALRTLGDRRLPSLLWDFDCDQRSLDGARRGGREGEVPRVWELCRGLQSGLDLPSLNFAQIPMLISRPLAALGLQAYVSEELTAGTKGECEGTSMAELLSSEESGLSKSASGLAVRDRALKGLADCRKERSEARFLHLTRGTVSATLGNPALTSRLLRQLGRLRRGLREVLHEATAEMRRAARTAVAVGGSCVSPALASGLRPSREHRQPLHVAGQLGRLGGKKVSLGFVALLRLGLKRDGLELLLPHLQPELGEAEVRRVAAACSLALLQAGRLAAARRSLHGLERLKGLLESSEQADKHELAIGEAADELARELVVGQCCCNGGDYDPRLLAFEFISRITLRSKQVRLVRSLVRSVEQKKPLVHQMLMGEGKTTVVTPLLALHTATAQRVCVVCCPSALLEFTQQVLRERLCAVLARPVLGFSFNRATPVSEDCGWYLRLHHAQDARAVLCTGPAAPKSLFLKFLLTVHEADGLLAECEASHGGLGRDHDLGASGRRLPVPLPGNGSSWRSWLAPLLGRDPGDQQRQSRLRELQYEMRVLARALGVFAQGVLLLDDIDLLMHPLRSELHWPLGRRRALDFTGTTGPSSASGQGMLPLPGLPGAWGEGAEAEGQALAEAGGQAGARWRLAVLLLDALFARAAGGPAAEEAQSQLQARGPGPKTNSGEAAGAAGGAGELLAELEAAVARGLRERQLQASPHLVLLSSDFYNERLLPLLARWMLLCLRRHHPMPLSDSQILTYISSLEPEVREQVQPSGVTLPLFEDLGDAQMKALNLTRSWLLVLLPHVASRIHRVHYGLLHESSPSWHQESRTRRHLAVPFVGKDVPSETSQFSHPDVQIGLTWLACRFDGLRHGDLLAALAALCKLQRSEPDAPPHRRRAHRCYCKWVSASGGLVRGDREDRRTRQPAQPLQPRQTGQPGQQAVLVLPPLEWMDVRDEVQMATVSEVLRKSPLLINFYLHSEVFPQLLVHTDSRLSASGQDLGSELFCGARLGFSGTPNDLLPRALGPCIYEPADDTKMLGTLTDPEVVGVAAVPQDWSAQSLLQLVASAQPPFSALIDVGALVTGLSNRQVAEALLASGLPHEGVVFLDDMGEQLLLQRGKREPVQLSRCMLPLERRFVFYDQVHTTGIDIRHAPAAIAALTLGKDSTFRDLAQGAYRMRGIGRGQRLSVLLVPEIAARIWSGVPLSSEALMVRSTSFVSASSNPGDMGPKSPGPGSQSQGAAGSAGIAGSGAGSIATKTASSKSSLGLSQVCTWLLVQQASSEQQQQQLLRMQSMEHEGRRCAYRALVEASDPRGEGALASETLRTALSVFQERVDFSVPTSSALEPDGGGRTRRDNGLNSIVERLRQLPLLDSEAEQTLQELLSGPRSGGTGTSMEELDLFVEQEQEKEQEEEQEEEHEQDGPAADTSQIVPWPALERDGPMEPWPMSLLQEAPNVSGPFYPASQLTLPVPNRRGALSVPFPGALWVSKNFHRPGGGSMRRLRWPTAILEWVTNPLPLPLCGSSQSPEGEGEDEDEGAAGARGTRATASGQSQGQGQETSLGGVEALADILSKLHLVTQILNPVGAASQDPQLSRELLRSLGVAVDDEDLRCILDLASAGPWPDALASALQHVELQPGRHYVLLSLEEAEAVRVWLHAQNRSPGIPRWSFALRLLGRSPLCLSLLDATEGWVEGKSRQQLRGLAACLLLLAAEHRYSQPELELLWRLLRQRPWEPRAALQPSVLRDFFLASQSVRRRAPVDWQGLPLAQLFETEDAHRRRSREAVVKAVHLQLQAQGLDPRATFEVLDGDKDGRLLPSDFRSPQALGLGLPMQLWARLFLALNLKGEGNGAIEVRTWTEAFQCERPGLEPANARASEICQVPQPQLPLQILRRVRIERVNHTSYAPVWNSEGTQCHKRVSIWSADQLVCGVMRMTALRLCVGHYANQGLGSIKGGGSAGVSRRQVLQIRDTSWTPGGIGEGLKAVADLYFPNPVKFRQVWDQQRGQPIFIWRPVPPSDSYVALGMVASTTPEPPPLDCVRCVAKSLCQPVHEPPIHIWDDRGGGGRPGSFWLVNSLQVLWAVEGHGAPQDLVWDLAEDAVFFDATGRPSVALAHERGGH